MHAPKVDSISRSILSSANRYRVGNIEKSELKLLKPRKTGKAMRNESFNNRAVVLSWCENIEKLESDQMYKINLKSNWSWKQKL